MWVMRTQATYRFGDAGDFQAEITSFGLSTGVSAGLADLDLVYLRTSSHKVVRYEL